MNSAVLESENELVRRALHQAVAAARSPASEELERGVGAVVSSWRTWADRAAAYVGQVLDDLDRMFDADVEDRLELVARSAGDWFGAERWSVLLLDDDRIAQVRGAPLVETLHLQPGGTGTGTEPTVAVEEIWTAFEGGSFVLVLGALTDEDRVDASVREAERHTVVGAGGYDADALSWLVCLSSEGTASELWSARAALVAAVQAALGFPRAPRHAR